MKALRTLTILFALALMCLPAPSAAAAEKPFKLDICAMPEHESFIFWYAKEQGWDKDEGLDFQIHFFQTGMDQLEALPAKQWVVGGTGTVPILVGALRYNTYLIGIANDESWVNAVTVRPDNPALKVKGWNPEYPNLLGSPETVKGKTFLYTQSSSQHFGMSEYLKALGLTEKDVVMQNMDPAQVLAAFDAGIGDFAGIWPMWLYIGMERGNKLIYQPGDVNAVLTLTLVGDKAFCDAHPDIVVKFLRVWLRGVNMIKKETRIPSSPSSITASGPSGPGRTSSRKWSRWILNTIRFSTSTSSLPSLTIPRAPARSNSGRTRCSTSLPRRGVSLPRK